MICVRHLFGSETVKSDFFKNLPIFLHTRETCSNIPSNLVDTINFKKSYNYLNYVATQARNDSFHYIHNEMGYNYKLNNRFHFPI